MRKCILLFVFLILLGAAGFFVYSRDGGGGSRSSVDRSVSYDGLEEYWKSKASFRRFTRVRRLKVKRDVEVSPLELKELLLRNKDIVELESQKRFDGQTVFVGYIVPKGQKRSNRCVTKKFAFSAGQRVLTIAEAAKALRVGKDNINGGVFGNVDISYVDIPCEGDTEYSQALQSEAVLDIEDQILALMSDLPKGP